MLPSGFFGQIGRLLDLYYTVNERLARMQEDIRQLQAEDRRMDAAILQLRSELSDLRARVAALEEGRNTLRAELRAVIAETIADLRIRYAEAEAQRTVQRESPGGGESPALPSTEE
jgi:chromosome segregation ATPase